MKRRIVEIDCCESFRGKCYIVERYGLFGWDAELTSYDRAGHEIATHFRSVEEADHEAQRMYPARPAPRVVKEYTT